MARHWPGFLPTVDGSHKDLRYVSAQTVASLVSGVLDSVARGYWLVDCRYPYEFAGGHIQGAVNIYTEQQVLSTFFPVSELPQEEARDTAVVFHCEFSSERGPKLCRALRRMDRAVNVYPTLCFPEIYLLRGGYREFFQQFQVLCEPQGYVSMLHEGHRAELRRLRGAGRTRKTLFTHTATR
eukprot:gi/632974847/ref/XP_007903903.1/ PREDICTED: M-phase inducer phosphatase 3-like [Callorhinchus milii]